MTADLDSDHIDRGSAADVVYGSITKIAPDTDPATLDPNEDLWYALDLDSMDQLNVMIAIGERVGIEIPEVDYPLLQTLQQLIDYLSPTGA